VPPARKQNRKKHFGHHQLASFSMATTHAQPDRRRGFASDNASGIHPAILEAIARANDGNQYPGYGNDPITNRAIGLFKQTFGSEDISVHFVYSGTAANVLGIGSLLVKNALRVSLLLLTSKRALRISMFTLSISTLRGDCALSHRRVRRP
jgi:glutamate/tyrosine decarboxylase-like PLP-dependent enzyme